MEAYLHVPSGTAPLRTRRTDESRNLQRTPAPIGSPPGRPSPKKHGLNYTRYADDLSSPVRWTVSKQANFARCQSNRFGRRLHRQHGENPPDGPGESPKTVTRRRGHQTLVFHARNAAACVPSHIRCAPVASAGTTNDPAQFIGKLAFLSMLNPQQAAP